MTGFLGGMRDKVLASTGIEDKAADALSQMLESDSGKAGLEQLMRQCDQAGIGEKARSWVGDGPKQALTPEEVQLLLTSDQAKFLCQLHRTAAVSLAACYCPLAAGRHGEDG